jgi:hypothetical protein
MQTAAATTAPSTKPKRDRVCVTGVAFIVVINVTRR